MRENSRNLILVKFFLCYNEIRRSHDRDHYNSYTREKQTKKIVINIMILILVKYFLCLNEWNQTYARSDYNAHTILITEKIVSNICFYYWKNTNFSDISICTLCNFFLSQFPWLEEKLYEIYVFHTYALSHIYKNDAYKYHRTISDNWKKWIVQKFFSWRLDYFYEKYMYLFVRFPRQNGVMTSFF